MAAATSEALGGTIHDQTTQKDAVLAAAKMVRAARLPLQGAPGLATTEAEIAALAESIVTYTMACKRHWDAWEKEVRALQKYTEKKYASTAENDDIRRWRGELWLNMGPNPAEAFPAKAAVLLATSKAPVSRVKHDLREIFSAITDQDARVMAAAAAWAKVIDYPPLPLADPEES